MTGASQLSICAFSTYDIDGVEFILGAFRAIIDACRRCR
jgi:hypothetical protein